MQLGLKIYLDVPDELAINYNEQADFDDGSCQYPDNGDFSLSFDGINSWVNLNDWSLDQEFTIEMWVKPDNNQNDIAKYFRLLT